MVRRERSVGSTGDLNGGSRASCHMYYAAKLEMRWLLVLGKRMEKRGSARPSTYIPDRCGLWMDLLCLGTGIKQVLLQRWA